MDITSTDDCVGSGAFVVGPDGGTGIVAPISADKSSKYISNA